jgi:hypothetical protein
VLKSGKGWGLVAAPSNEPAAPFALVNELVRQTRLNTISAPRRQRLHLAAADAIEGLYPHEGGVRAAEIAHHLAAGPPQLTRRLSEDLEVNRTAKLPLLLAPALAEFSVIEFLRRQPGRSAGLCRPGEPRRRWGAPAENTFHVV